MVVSTTGHTGNIYRDAHFCECSATLMQKYIGLYLLTGVRSHALIVVL